MPIHVRDADLQRLQSALILFRLPMDRKPSGELPVELDELHDTINWTSSIRSALRFGDIRSLGVTMDLVWGTKQKTHPDVITDEIRSLRFFLQTRGMVGAKVCGTGGHLLALCHPPMRVRLLDAAKERGLDEIPFRFVQDGLLSWKAPIRTIDG